MGLSAAYGGEKAVGQPDCLRILPVRITGDPDECTAGTHRFEQQVRVCDTEQKNDTGRRLLKKLQGGILRIEIHEFRLFNNVRLAAGFIRQNLGIDKDIPDLGDGKLPPEISALVRLSGDGDDIRMNPGSRFATAPAHAAGNPVFVQTDRRSGDLPRSAERIIP